MDAKVVFLRMETVSSRPSDKWPYVWFLFFCHWVALGCAVHFFQEFERLRTRCGVFSRFAIVVKKLSVNCGICDCAND